MPIKIACFLLEPWVNTAGNQLGTVFLGIMEKILRQTIAQSNFCGFSSESTFSCVGIDSRGKSTLNSVWIAFKTGKWFAFRLKTWQKLFQSFANTDFIQKMKHQHQSRSRGVSTLQNVFKVRDGWEFMNEMRFQLKLGPSLEKKNISIKVFAARPKRDEIFEDQTSIISTLAENCFSQEFDQKFCRNPVRSSWHALRSAPKIPPRDIFYLLCCRINLYPSWILRLSSIVVV